MGNTISLASKARNTFGKNVKRLRAQGIMPGVVYGHGSSTDHIEVSTKDFNRVYRDAGTNTIIDLEVDGKTVKTIIYNVDFDPISDTPRHADFYKVRMNEKLTTQVPLNFVGESPAVRTLSAIIVHGKETVEVSCLPGDLPHAIDVDLNKLVEIDDMIQAKDLQMPANVELKEEPETMLAQAILPREMKIDTAPVAPAAVAGEEGTPAAEGSAGATADAGKEDKKAE